MKTAPGHIRQIVESVVQSTPVEDIHTHLYDPAFGDLLLYGIDDLLVYHYLVAEGFRYFESPYAAFWNLSKTEQADLIWETLFLEHTPISEAARGVLTVLNRLGLDVKKRDLPTLRKWFAKWKPDAYTTHCLEKAGVRSICMTNSPFDPAERAVWDRKFRRDPRFRAALRIDPLLLSWDSAGKDLVQMGYKVKPDLGPQTISEIRRFLEDWTQKMDAQFLMVSFPPDFVFPDKSPCSTIIEQAVLPHCRESGLPFALMPGVNRAVNPQLKLAGDGLGLSNLRSLQNLCAGFPENKFLCTILARENQHELAVLARKFRNLHIFGCWWFTNIPSLVEEITRMRVELLGLSFTPQHSDARVLDQIIYKWDHSRKIIARVLADKYEDLGTTGWVPKRAEIERDVQLLFGGAYARFSEMSLGG